MLKFIHIHAYKYKHILIQFVNTGIVDLFAPPLIKFCSARKPDTKSRGDPPVMRADIIDIIACDDRDSMRCTTPSCVTHIRYINQISSNSSCV